MTMSTPACHNAGRQREGDGTVLHTATAGAPRCSFGDELASSLIHGLGTALSIAALVLLVVFAALDAGAMAVVACTLFGVSLVVLYAASTLYHALSLTLPRPALQALDHVAIYVLIAGTYTPFSLLALAGARGWTLFGVVWALALAGIALELGVAARWRKWSVLLYVGMGWIAVVAFGPLSASLQTGGMVLLLAGGAAYTLGVPFYLWRRLPFHHALWHVFVLAGSVLHFLAVLLYVIPDATAI